jgi:hypothetical protein
MQRDRLGREPSRCGTTPTAALALVIVSRCSGRSLAYSPATTRAGLQPRLAV